MSQNDKQTGSWGPGEWVVREGEGDGDGDGDGVGVGGGCGGSGRGRYFHNFLFHKRAPPVSSSHSL